MFEPSDGPRYFGVPVGVDFPRAVVSGLREHLKHAAPHAMGRVTLYVNTRRMQRRIRAIFDDGPAGFVPKIRLVTDLSESLELAHIPKAVPPLRRRLELVRLISTLLDADPNLAPRSSLFDLADSLMKLMEEMQGEGVSPDAIRGLDVSDQSGHWENALQFINIVQTYFRDQHDAPDREARQRRVIEELTALWANTPPTDPIIVAGSTGSRGATALFMKAVAALPLGAVILPGYDFSMPAECWDDLSDALTAEDHPQFRFRRLLADAGLPMTAVRRWSAEIPVCEDRNRLVSLALRPAPVTDQWLSEGPDLAGIETACADLTLVEAPTPRSEALAIALRLLKAAGDGQTAALVTPDRLLTRQVEAALQRWNILPDDSAGTPLPLTPSGRLLRHVLSLIGTELTAESLLTVLKHPLTQGDEHLWVQELELSLRKNGPPFPTRDALLVWAENQKVDARDWINWIFDTLDPLFGMTHADFGDFLAAHITAAEALARGPDREKQSLLWLKDDGEEALKQINAMRDESDCGLSLDVADYRNLFSAILSGGQVRNSEQPHPNILIWGTLEARVQGAELLILGGLNEGTWPERPDPDPWMNRAMRLKAGLLLPERRIGLSAHDFQQAIAAPEVWLTRSKKSDDAETVPSRWVNRLTNLLGGLEAGKPALQAMRARGDHWLALTNALEQPVDIDKAKRPSPRPPVSARPKRLSVTAIKHLIRDPYAIYARDILRLRPLDPLVLSPDARLRGTLLHRIMERFIDERTVETPEQARVRLLTIAETVLAQDAPWPTARSIWKAKLERVADWFLEREMARLPNIARSHVEAKGAVDIADPEFRLTGTADRIDRDHDGQLHIYDYKTGSPPTKKQQTHFDKQLLLEAWMAEQGGFDEVEKARVAGATFIGLGATPKEEPAPIGDDEEGVEVTWARFLALLTRYADPAQGYTARRAMFSEKTPSDYDQLARFGEWDISDDAVVEDLS